MKAFALLSAAELRLLARDPGSLFFMVAFPLMLLILNSGGEGPEIEIFLPGYIVMILAIGGLSALPATVATYRERKVLRRLAATPVAPLTLLAAQIGAQIVMGLAGSAIVVGVGVLGYGAGLPDHVAVSLLAFLLCALMLYALGFVIAALAPRAKAAELLGLLVMFPMIFLGGAAIPREGLSEELLRMGEHLPLTYAVTALRDGWFGSPGALPLLVLAGITVIGTAVAAVLFRWE
ncbi:ABC transporter permease [Planomonospora corallina]|uniref:Transport permease protein n=1 Tax=Planomonospora corallina TaxID=1806052 RepID=A0ABV8I7H2_9ACTN